VENERSLAVRHANDGAPSRISQGLWEWSPRTGERDVSRGAPRNGEHSGVRRLLLLALAGLLVAPASSRAGSLSADVVIGGEAHFNVYGSDRASYLIDVVVQSSEAGMRGGSGSVAVTIRRCQGLGCSKRMTFQGALAPGAFTVAEDLSSGSLTTRLFGKPFDVRWDGAQSSTLPAYRVSPDGPRVAARLYVVTHASGLLLGRRCGSQDGLVSREALVASSPVVSSPLPRSLPRALTGLARGTC
jgi:hypothetical protein